MLQKLGWTEGQGLGIDGGGIINPINKYAKHDEGEWKRERFSFSFLFKFFFSELHSVIAIKV